MGIGVFVYWKFKEAEKKRDAAEKARKAAEDQARYEAERAEHLARHAAHQAERQAMMTALDRLSRKIPTSTTQYITGRRIRRQLQVISVTSNHSTLYSTTGIAPLTAQEHARYEFLQEADRIRADAVVNLKIVSRQYGIVTQGDAVELD